MIKLFGISLILPNICGCQAMMFIAGLPTGKGILGFVIIMIIIGAIFVSFHDWEIKKKIMEEQKRKEDEEKKIRECMLRKIDKDKN